MYPQVPAVLFDNSIRYPEPDTGAPLALGGVERLKQLGKVIGSNTRTIVENADAHAFGTRVPTPAVADGDDQFVAVGGQRIHRIDNQIGKDLSQFA